jgi:hypothetical protein
MQIELLRYIQPSSLDLRVVLVDRWQVTVSRQSSSHKMIRISFSKRNYNGRYSYPLGRADPAPFIDRCVTAPRDGQVFTPRHPGDVVDRSDACKHGHYLQSYIFVRSARVLTGSKLEVLSHTAHEIEVFHGDCLGR